MNIVRFYYDDYIECQNQTADNTLKYSCLSCFYESCVIDLSHKVYNQGLNIFFLLFIYKNCLVWLYKFSYAFYLKHQKIEKLKKIK